MSLGIDTRCALRRPYQAVKGLSRKAACRSRGIPSLPPPAFTHTVGVHRRTVWSFDPEASREPSVEKFTHCTAACNEGKQGAARGSSGDSDPQLSSVSHKPGVKKRQQVFSNSTNDSVSHARGKTLAARTHCVPDEAESALGGLEVPNYHRVVYSSGR